MLNNITMGQYYPVDSKVHRLDPRIKLILTIVFIVVVFMAKTFLGYALILGFVWLTSRLANVPLRMLLRGLKPLRLIIILTFLLNLFFTAGETTWVEFWIIRITKEGFLQAAFYSLRLIIILTFLLNLFFTSGETTWVEFWIIRITKEGFMQAAFYSLRLVFLVIGTSLLTLTTSPVSLSDGIELLLTPLKKIHFPAHELAMMMTIALRFIPTLLEETDKIMKAQMARGADFESGNLVSRAKAMVPLLVPLFVSAFRRAGDLAMAMESRCYHGGNGRTRLRVLKITKNDWIACGAMAALLALIILEGIFL